MSDSTSLNPKTFSRLFQFSMWWRIFYGGLRIFLGLALLRVIGEPLIDIVTTVMDYELLQKTPDILFTLISDLLSRHQFSVTYFLAFYFIFWGSVDAILSHHMLKDDLWAFPISLGLISLFIAYSLFRLTYTHSAVLAGVIIMDIVIMILIHKEYKKVLRLRRGNETT